MLHDPSGGGAGPPGERVKGTQNVKVFAYPIHLHNITLYLQFFYSQEPQNIATIEVLTVRVPAQSTDHYRPLNQASVPGTSVESVTKIAIEY